MKAKLGVVVPWHLVTITLLSLPSIIFNVCLGQTDDYENPAAPPPGLDDCNVGIFLACSFTSREKEYPKVKNASAQAWGFKSLATITNTGEYELKSSQHKEMLVSASGAIIVDGDDFPMEVGIGTILAGNPQVDLKMQLKQREISAQIEITGSVFGIKPPGVPMPENIKLVNDGYRCPKPTLRSEDTFDILHLSIFNTPTQR
ncbi:COBRA-LIKE PROTEIN 7 [Salix koriyanagi]|uniref:COBRA-LIKE PROTEIN 7 n=1 Tax=Salix koriyanagi TaxID=2511006 RepID=A0A9Q0UDL4_9ROSI|nr:COBRA-LIKE PROTEIN 7 [Salix koriyanagi]